MRGSAVDHVLRIIAGDTGGGNAAVGHSLGEDGYFKFGRKFAHCLPGVNRETGRDFQPSEHDSGIRCSAGFAAQERAAPTHRLERCAIYVYRG